MTTRSLFILVSVLHAVALLLTVVTTIQLIRARHAPARKAWRLRALAPPAVYVLSIVPFAAGLLLMAPNARLSVSGLLEVLGSMFRHPDFVWPTAVTLLVYALVMAIASHVGVRRLGAGHA